MLSFAADKRLSLRATNRCSSFKRIGRADHRVADGDQLGAFLRRPHAVLDLKAADADRNRDGPLHFVEPLGRVLRARRPCAGRRRSAGRSCARPTRHTAGAAAWFLTPIVSATTHTPFFFDSAIADLHGFVGRVGADGHHVAALLVGALHVLPARVHGLVVGQHRESRETRGPSGRSAPRPARRSAACRSPASRRRPRCRSWPSPGPRRSWRSRGRSE